MMITWMAIIALGFTVYADRARTTTAWVWTGAAWLIVAYVARSQ